MSSSEEEEEEDNDEEEEDEEESEEEDEDEEEDDDDDDDDDEDEYDEDSEYDEGEVIPDKPKARPSSKRDKSSAKSSEYEYEYEYEYEDEDPKAKESPNAKKPPAQEQANKLAASTEPAAAKANPPPNAQTKPAITPTPTKPAAPTPAKPQPATTPTKPPAANTPTKPATNTQTKSPAPPAKPVDKYAAVEKKLLDSDSGEVIAVHSPIFSTPDGPAKEKKASAQPSKKDKVGADGDKKKQSLGNASPSKAKQIEANKQKKSVRIQSSTKSKIKTKDTKSKDGKRKSSKKKKSDYYDEYYDDYQDYYYGGEPGYSSYLYSETPAYVVGGSNSDSSLSSADDTAAFFSPTEDGDSSSSLKESSYHKRKIKTHHARYNSGKIGSSYPSVQGKSSNKLSRGDRIPSFFFLQVMTFIALYVSYFFYLLNRKSFSHSRYSFYETEYTSYLQIDMILSSQSLAYAVSRSCAGILADKIRPTTLCTVGLFTSSLFIIAFADADNFLAYCTLAFMNGAVQGFGWPAVAKLAKIWLSPAYLGLCWSVLSTTSNVAEALGPHLISFLAAVHTWRVAMQLPAAIGMVFSLAFFFVLRDYPSDTGHKNKDPRNEGKSNLGWGHVLRAPIMWVLIGGYMVVFCIKLSAQHWGQHFLVEGRGLTSLTVDAYLNSLEVGGLVGCITVGGLSDFMVKMMTKRPTGSHRMLLTQIAVGGIAVCLNLMLFTVYQYTSSFWVCCLGMMMGFCTYGAICLFGIMVMECTPLHMVGFVHTLLGMASNCGSTIAGDGILSGIPVIFITNYFDWMSAFIALEVVCLMTFFALVLTKDLPHSLDSSKKYV